MEYTEIKKALKAHGYSWSVAGTAMDVTAQHVMNVASRRSESLQVAKGISALIGKKVDVVFPDVPRYSASDDQMTREDKVEQARSMLKQSNAAS